MYDDFPACLPRYAWLVNESARNLAMLFNDPEPHYCKACGEPVARPFWASHRRGHVHDLAVNAKRRARENAARLRRLNRLRAEGRNLRV